MENGISSHFPVFQFSNSVFSTGKGERVFHAHEPEIVLWFSSLVFQIIRFCVIKTLKAIGCNQVIINYERKGQACKMFTDIDIAIR